MIPPRIRRRWPRTSLRNDWALEPRTLLTVFNVNSFADILSPPAGTVTLRSAIQAANNSPGADTINLVSAGTYRITTISTLTDNSAGEFAIADAGDLTIQNASGGVVTVDAGGHNRVFDVDPAAAAMPFTVIFRGLTIQDGVVNNNGGGIRAASAAGVILDHDTVQNNISLQNGAGIAFEPGSTGALTLIGSHVLGNSALTSGGGIAALGSGAVVVGLQSEIAGNDAFNANGGGIWVKGPALAVGGSVIHDNLAINGSGGGIDNDGAGAVTIVGSIVQGNDAKNGGGYADTSTSTLTVLDSFFLNNAAGTNGGGIDAGGPTITLTNSTVAGNKATLGGGLHIHGTGMTRITDSSILGNTGNGAGGIADEASKLLVTGSTFASNHALGNGGAIAAFGTVGDVSISNSLFRDNATYGSGGALFFLGGTLEVSASRFTGNSSQGGGAVNLSTSSFSIVNSTFDANRATTCGGGAFTHTGSSNALTNDTFFGNAALQDGVILVSGAANTTLTMIDDTVDGNTTTTIDSGLEQLNGTLVVQGTILAKNTAAGAPSDYTYSGGTLTDKGGNLLGSTNGTGGKFGVGTIIADPKLGPLVNNGGQLAGAPSTSLVVPTQALLPGSPAFGTGVATGAPTTDERGFGRPAHPSIGAYEPQYASNATANQVFVENAYEILFNQVADPAGLAASTNFLNGGGSPTTLVQILQSGAPYLNNVVIQLYRRYLDRAPSAGEMTAVVNFLKSGTTPEQLAAALIGSAEFTADFGGGQNDVFIQAAFVATVGRPTASQAELTAWDGVLAAGLSHATVGNLLVTSTEYLFDLIVADFDAYVGRPPKPTDLAAFTAASKAGITSTGLAAVALASSFAVRT